MQELLNLINTLLIDNNVMYVTPARLRLVLTQMVTAIYGNGSGGGAVPTISTYDPLEYNGFTGELKFLPAKLGSVLWVGRGYKWGFDPSEDTENGDTTDPQPGAFFISSDFEGNIFFSRWNGEGDWHDIENHVFNSKERIRAPEGETQEEE